MNIPKAWRIAVVTMVGGASLFVSDKFWTTTGPAHFTTQAEAIIGRPLTPLSIAGVARRTTRRAVAAGAIGYGAYAGGRYGYPYNYGYTNYSSSYPYSNYGSSYPNNYGYYSDYGDYGMSNAFRLRHRIPSGAYDYYYAPYNTSDPNGYHGYVPNNYATYCNQMPKAC